MSSANIKPQTQNTFLFTSESVGEGHPDKICDQISDAVLDACLKLDQHSKLRCETITKTGMVMIFGVVHTKANVNYPEIVRDTVKRIGYNDSNIGLDYKTCSVFIGIEHNTIPRDITRQGVVFGYATDETPQLIPLTAILAHNLNKKIAECRRNGTLPWIRPDSKSQVTMEYRLDNGACIPLRAHTIVISVQHSENISNDEMRKDLKEFVIKSVVPEKYLDDSTIYHLQPSGSFVIGGPQGDAGLTGRKTIVDTYGGWGSHGGGAFSGKDPSAVERCGSYAARWIAKSLVIAGLARRVLIQISYAPGINDPVSLSIDAYGTSNKTHEELLDIVENNFNLSPNAIVEELDLLNPMYEDTAVYGHFGCTEFPWEKPKVLKL